MAVVFLGIAMLAAIAIATLRSRSRRYPGGVVSTSLCLAVLVDFWPAPFPLLPLKVPGLYSHLQAVRHGSVAELPLGIRDGFGEQGHLDHRVLYYQTWHQRPLLGGFVARLSPSLAARHQETPVIGSLLQLSSGQTLSAEQVARDVQLAPELVRRWNVSAIVIRKREASGELIRYVTGVLNASRLAGDEERDLYIVGGAGAELPRRGPRRKQDTPAPR